ncbi:helix-turn-helix transcriptional regulator [Bacillus cabrialesii]|uniref:Helix-turn-helix transcriptional regulator n=1 Tax=Bacillus cabrialesii subsp. tritici TaxID=2944916 RepID=A0ABT9DRP8_9BACI|nr:helix-turn-helix transcriptional regulator [Bacillus cabrialesii]MDO8227376.1 helix-turn-helix transcriptional regulator [Bacillus cabrialesii subsp. tritici]
MNNYLKLERTRANLTQEQLAEKIGVTRQTIGLIEKGKYNPSLQLCLKICIELKVTLNDVFWTHNREEETDEG